MKKTHLSIPPYFFKLCLYCHGNADSKDHVPPRLLLEKPFPRNLITVPACVLCNNGFSLDEQYFRDGLAQVGFSPTLRSKLEQNGIVTRSITRAPKYRKLIENALVEGNDGRIFFNAKLKRFERIVIKIALGILFHEYQDYPITKEIICQGVFHSHQLPLWLIDLTRRRRLIHNNLWPDVGTPALTKVVCDRNRSMDYKSFRPWKVIQPQVFEYILRPDPDHRSRGFCIMKFHETLWGLVQFKRNNTMKY